jgi:hypothetical protein
MKGQEGPCSERLGRFISFGVGLRYSPTEGAQHLVLPAVMAEHKHQTKEDDEEEKARLEVHSTAKKVVPGPGVLREGHGKQFNGCKHQQKTAEVFWGMGQPCVWTTARPMYVRSIAQEFPASPRLCIIVQRYESNRF